MTHPRDEKTRGPIPGLEVPAPERLVIGTIVVCEKGEMLTPEQFGERVGRALRKAAGLPEDYDGPVPRWRLLSREELAALEREK